MCGDIIDQILHKTFERIAALSINPCRMLYWYVDDSVGCQHQKVSDLRQVCICLHHCIYKEATDQTVTGDLKIRVFAEHLRSCPHRKFRSEFADKSMLSAFIARNDRINIIAFSHNIYHLRKFFRLMLQVIIHGYNKITFHMCKSTQKRRMLSKISCHLYDANSIVLCTKFLHDFKGTVFGTVIHKNQFKLFFYYFPEYFFKVCSELYTGTTTEYKLIGFPFFLNTQ